MTPNATNSRDLTRNIYVGWQLLQLGRAQITSLEERATRVVPAQTAGLVALWTQLHEFDKAAAKVLAWGAWASSVFRSFCSRG